MAARLARTGHELFVWNRTIEKARPLEQYGARVASSLDELSRVAEVVFVMVSDDEASREVLSAVLREGRPRIIVNHSTVSPMYTREAVEEAKRRGVEYLAIPVMGGPSDIERGEGVCIVGGREEVFREVEPLTSAYCKEHVLVGSQENASVIKLALNSMYFSALEALAEALLLVEAWNVEPKVFFDAASRLWLRVVVDRYAKRLLDEKYPTSFQLRLAAKDLHYAVFSGYHKGQPLPMLSELAKTFLEASTIGGLGRRDYTRIYYFLKRGSTG